MKSLDPVRVYRTIIACRGNITRLLRELDITSTQLNIYLDDNPGLKQAFVNARESLVDQAEEVLHEAIAAKKSWAICFVLRSLGKDRGYGAPSKKKSCLLDMMPQFELDLAQLSPAELARWEQLQNICHGRPDGTYPEFMQPLIIAEVDIKLIFTQCGNNISNVADRLGITRDQLLQFIARKPEWQNILYDRRVELIDFAEEMLQEALTDQKAWAVRFVAKTLGSTRGYGDPKLDQTKPARITGLDDPKLKNLSDAQNTERINLTAKMLAPPPSAPEEPTAEMLPLTAAAAAAPVKDAPAMAIPGPAEPIKNAPVPVSGTNANGSTSKPSACAPTRAGKHRGASADPADLR